MMAVSRQLVLENLCLDVLGCHRMGRQVLECDVVGSWNDKVRFDEAVLAGENHPVTALGLRIPSVSPEVRAGVGVFGRRRPSIRVFGPDLALAAAMITSFIRVLLR